MAQHQGRSGSPWAPALVLAIGPTLGLGLVDDDAARLVAAALLCTGGGPGRGCAAASGAAVPRGRSGWWFWASTSGGEYLVQLPRWITLGAVGVVLMWVGATFEHRRRDWRRASDAIGHFR